MIEQQLEVIINRLQWIVALGAGVVIMLFGILMLLSDVLVKLDKIRLRQ